MKPTLVNVGFNSVVMADRIVAVLASGSTAMRRIKDNAKAARRLIDATQGRRTRSIIVTDSNHVILSSVQPETIANRYLRELKEVS